jgi:2-amino-4-hydroxy-6-hydroxymethyldihydropteridine diphosphokinase
MVVCYIGLGSNLGDREYYINTAISKLRSLLNTRVTKISKIIQTEPVGGSLQGPYLNCVIEMQTDLSPFELLEKLQKIETDLGRVRTTVRNAARNIDLDILLFGEAKIKENSLCIPHPRMFERKFVMNSLKEVAPQVLKRLRTKVFRSRKMAGRKRSSGKRKKR